MRHNVEGGLGNFTVQDSTAVLAVTLDSVVVDNLQQDSLQMSVARMYDLQLRTPATSEHDYADFPNAIMLSEYKKAVVSYIAGFVVRMVKKKISCCDCQSALTASHEACLAAGTQASTSVSSLTSTAVDSQFLTLINRGGLIKASDSVIIVCEETEKCFQRMRAAVGDKLPQTSNFVPSVCAVVLSEVGLKAFTALHDHMFDTTAECNHIFNLIKCITTCYCTVRMHHLAKQKTVAVTGPLVRKKLTKLVLFSHQ
jgi:hypothetical protein